MVRGTAYSLRFIQQVKFVQHWNMLVILTGESVRLYGQSYVYLVIINNTLRNFSKDLGKSTMFLSYPDVLQVFAVNWIQDTVCSH